MSLVKNKSGAEIAFEIALAFMLDDLREFLESLHLSSKQAFFTMYETLYEAELGEPCSMSAAQPIYA